MSATRYNLIAAGLLVGTTRGEKLVARFCAAVAEGRTPDEADLQAVAGALSLFLDGKGYTDARAVKVAKRLGVTHKQGRQPGISHAELERYGRAVVEYEDLVETVGKREAHKRVCEAHGIARQTLNDRIKKYSSEVHHLRELDTLTASFPK